MRTFQELGVDKAYIKGINELGINTPTDIQGEVIPLLLTTAIDIVAQAQTGTGKTAAYGLPLLQNIDAKNKLVQGLILCPTRELCQQIAKQLFKFTKYADKIFSEAVYGGAPIEQQLSALKRPTHIVVATPGRLIDLLKKKAVDLSNVTTVVLDEADEMLSMGFKDDLDTILESLSKAQNKWLFSATIPEGIKQIVNQHMSENVKRIQISAKNVVNKNIVHQFIICEEDGKFETLKRFLKSVDEERGVIFTRTKADAQKLAFRLQEHAITADAIHGDLKQKERDKVMRAFKSGRIRLLVATDLAARGLDIPSLAFVIHYQLPEKQDQYTHRSGRTARAGKGGISLCLLNSFELNKLRTIESRLGIAFQQKH